MIATNCRLSVATAQFSSSAFTAYAHVNHKVRSFRNVCHNLPLWTFQGVMNSGFGDCLQAFHKVTDFANLQYQQLLNNRSVDYSCLVNFQTDDHLSTGNADGGTKRVILVGLGPWQTLLHCKGLEWFCSFLADASYHWLKRGAGVSRWSQWQCIMIMCRYDSRPQLCICCCKAAAENQLTQVVRLSWVCSRHFCCV